MILGRWKNIYDMQKEMDVNRLRGVECRYVRKVERYVDKLDTTERAERQGKKGRKKFFE